MHCNEEGFFHRIGCTGVESVGICLNLDVYVSMVGVFERERGSIG